MPPKFCIIQKLLHLFLLFLSLRVFENFHVNSLGIACQRHRDSSLLVEVFKKNALWVD